MWLTLHFVIRPQSSFGSKRGYVRRRKHLGGKFGQQYCLKDVTAGNIRARSDCRFHCNPDFYKTLGGRGLILSCPKVNWYTGFSSQTSLSVRFAPYA